MARLARSTAEGAAYEAEGMLLRAVEMCGRRDVGAARDAAEVLLPACEHGSPRAEQLARRLRRWCWKWASARGADAERWSYCWERTLRWMAHEDLVSYLEYVELSREPEEKFWVPRRGTYDASGDEWRGGLSAAARALQRIEDGGLDEVFLSQPPRTGKLLADDTPILTTKGWKRHGDLKVGDYVFSPDGRPTKVIRVLPKHHTTHTVTFTDGTKIECHFRHEWRVYDRHLQRWTTLETQEIAKQVEENGPAEGRGHRYRYQIEIPKPIEGVDVELAVPPYTMGAWLGDGSNRQPRITGDRTDHQIIDRVAEDGYEIGHTYVHKTTGVLTTSFVGLRADLQKYGMCYDDYRVEKRIPECYLVAPVDQRLQLLAGLLDTDGCLSEKEHRYHFTTAEPRLRDDFESLVATFGWRFSCVEYEPSVSTSGIEGKHPYWTVAFNPTIEIPCVLERKRLREFSKQRRISIKSVEPSEPKPGNCITVERDGMYLAGRELVPTHNTGMSTLFVTHLIGRFPETSNLYSSYSDTVTTAFYQGVLEIITDPVTYRWAEVFPECNIASKNAADTTLNLVRKKKYPTFTARSVVGTLNGACDCSGVLIADDLCSGYEEAISRTRMEKLEAIVENDLLSRCKSTTRKVWIGTRWTTADPIGCRLETLREDAAFSSVRYEDISVPALSVDPKTGREESNFDYPYGVGFSTDDYLRTRAQFERRGDQASWLAQYQQQPIERQGAVFDPDDLRYFSGDAPVGARTFMAVDPAFGGSDYTAAPVCVDDGEDVWVVDAVFSDREKDKTMPMLVAAAAKWGVQEIRFEANRMLQSYVDEFRAQVRDAGLRLAVTSRPADNRKSKETRIMGRAPEIRERFVFRDAKSRTNMYRAFMDNVFEFNEKGTARHDDAPDSLAMAAEMVFRRQEQRGGVFKRFW